MNYNPGKTNRGKYLYGKGVHKQQAANADAREAARQAEQNAQHAAAMAQFMHNRNVLVAHGGYPPHNPIVFPTAAAARLAVAEVQGPENFQRLEGLAQGQLNYQQRVAAARNARLASERAAAGGAAAPAAYAPAAYAPAAYAPAAYAPAAYAPEQPVNVPAAEQRPDEVLPGPPATATRRTSGPNARTVAAAAAEQKGAFGRFKNWVISKWRGTGGTRRYKKLGRKSRKSRKSRR
jgi:hypothetical protein